MIRVFPRKTKWTPTDELAFVGEPTLFRPGDRSTPVMVSCTFTWDMSAADQLRRSWSRFYDRVEVGGPAFGHPGGVFVPGQFVKEGVTITSRGCPRRCAWCFAWRREGDIRELPIRDGWIVQDNNLLATSYEHQRAVFRMLDRQPKAAVFSGGLDTHYLSVRNAAWISHLRVAELWFACDRDYDLDLLRRARQIFSQVPTEKMRCYVLIGFGRETVQQAEDRLEAVYAAGFLPFAQFYQPKCRERRVPRNWRALVRKWSRPAAYRGVKTGGGGKR